jgi:hypothetical protein
MVKYAFYVLVDWAVFLFFQEYIVVKALKLDGLEQGC